MSFGKKILFYLIMFAVFPAVFLAVVEGALAVMKVADPYTSEDPYAGFKNYVNVFIDDPDHPDRLVINPRRAEWRVNPTKIAKAIHLQYMDKVKADNGYRVFLFGGSNTFNFQTELHILIDRLKKAYPDRKIEVVNLGGNAYGTHRIVKLFEEVVNYDPDLLIVYSGHNEFVEKRFYEGILKEPPWLTSVKGFLGKFRFYTLMRRVIRDAKSSSVGFFTKKDEAENREGRMMFTNDVALDTTPYNKRPFFEEVMRQYEFNLEKMAHTAASHGVRLVFSTVASRDMTPPYAACYDSSIGEENNKKLNSLTQEIARILSSREFEQIKSYEEQFEEVKPYLEKARPLLDQAGKIAPQNADVIYWSGFVKYFEGDYEEAKRLMMESVTHDCSPRRSTPITNGIVREVARRNSLDVIDAVSLIEDHSRRRISYGHAERAAEEGWGLFFDHCHLNNIGRALVMNLFADTIINKGWAGEKS